MPRRAFTLIELLVVIGIIAVLLLILIPVVGKSRESSRRAVCAANLRALGQGFRAYMEANGEGPRTKYDISPGGILRKSGNSFSESIVTTAFTCARGANPFSGTATESTTGSTSGTPANNDVTAAMFLLIRTNHMNQKQYVCPSAQGALPDTFEAGSAQKRSNFTSRANLSYSYTMPYPGESPLGNFNDGNGDSDAGTGNSNPGVIPPASHAGYTYGKQMKPTWPIAADLNPGNTGSPALTSLTLNSSPADMKQGNSLNHERNGQNVLYFAGNVDWAKTPFAGAEQDNMYTRAKSIPDNLALTPSPDRASDTIDYKKNLDVNIAFGKQPPTNRNDTILLPTSGSEGLLPYKKVW